MRKVGIVIDGFCICSGMLFTNLSLSAYHVLRLRFDKNPSSTVVASLPLGGTQRRRPAQNGSRLLRIRGIVLFCIVWFCHVIMRPLVAVATSSSSSRWESFHGTPAVHGSLHRAAAPPRFA